MRALLKIQNISYRYNDKNLVLDNVSTTFHAGERIAVLGSNGAGKSTFFLCCNGVLRPQSGKIFYDDHEITKRDIFKLRQAVGLVFQDSDSQIIAGTVESEVSFGPMNLRLASNEVSSRVDKALEQMNISRYRDHAPQYLSAGEKKRVGIADILAMQPEIILFDEPTASLDPQNSDTFEDILDELNRAGITLVISTHDVDFAYRVAQRAIVFAQGKIIADTDIDEVFTSDNVIKMAGLKKPLLYEAFDFIQHSFLNTKNLKKPRTIEEFRVFVSKLMNEKS